MDLLQESSGGRQSQGQGVVVGDGDRGENV